MLQTWYTPSTIILVDEKCVMHPKFTWYSCQSDNQWAHHTRIIPRFAAITILSAEPCMMRHIAISFAEVDLWHKTIFNSAECQQTNYIHALPLPQRKKNNSNMPEVQKTTSTWRTGPFMLRTPQQFSRTVQSKRSHLWIPDYSIWINQNMQQYSAMWLFSQFTAHLSELRTDLNSHADKNGSEHEKAGLSPGCRNLKSLVKHKAIWLTRIENIFSFLQKKCSKPWLWS